MASRKTIGIAPLVIGILMAGNAAIQLIQTMPQTNWTAAPVIYSIVMLIGSLAAIVIGARILLGLEEVEQDSEKSTKTAIVFGALAVIAFGVGVWLALA